MADKITASIYRIYDPRQPEVTCYVGQTRNSLLMRLAGHVHHARKDTTPQAQWITKLLDEGVRPEIELVETVFLKEANGRERHWIAYYREAGAPLNNVSDGVASNIHMDRRQNDSNPTQDRPRESGTVDGSTGAGGPSTRDDQRRRAPRVTAVRDGGGLDLKLRNRCFRIDNDSWDLFLELTRLNGTTASEVLRQKMEIYCDS